MRAREWRSRGRDGRRSRKSPDARPPGPLGTTRSVTSTGAESDSLLPASETGAPGARQRRDHREQTACSERRGFAPASAVTTARPQEEPSPPPLASRPPRNDLRRLRCATLASALSPRQSRRRDCPCWLEADTFVEPVTSPVLVHCGSVTSRQSVSEAIGPERERRPGPGRHSMTLLGPARSRTGRGGSPNRQR